MPQAINPLPNGQKQSKRRKLNDGTVHPTKIPSLFAPFRTAGLVSPTSVPFSSLPLGKTTFQITTSVGRCLHTYDLRKGLNLVFLSRPQTPCEITAICSWKDRVFAAWSQQNKEREWGVWVFKRGRKVGELEKPVKDPQTLKRILVYGAWIVGCSPTRIEVWKSETFEHYVSLEPASSRSLGSDLLTGEICTLPTFLNKLFVGKRDGGVDIWNISTGKLVFTLLPTSSSSSAVSALQASPSLSILAIGREDGTIHLHDVLKDETILELNRGRDKAAIISISFRTDGLGAGSDGAEDGIMATVSRGSGDVTFWDLNRGGRVAGVLYGAHNAVSFSTADSGGINRVEFLPGQDVLITSGSDNALKSWIFDADQLQTVPRILHQRGGHAAPPAKLMFLPTNSDNSDSQGKWLISAGRDRALWGWSLRRDGQSTELSQGSIQKKARKLGLNHKNLDSLSASSIEDLKAPEITSFACSLNRDGGIGTSSSHKGIWSNAANAKISESNDTGNAMTSWESIVTAHRADKFARTWFWGSKRAGRWALETADGTEVTSVAVTSCGTFALVGSSGGSISSYNLQSGILRHKYPSPITPLQARKLKMEKGDSLQQVNGGDDVGSKYGPGRGKHEKAVSGLVVDNLNRTMISCSLDGRIKFWDFTAGLLIDQIDWFPMTAIIACQYHRPNELLALSCDDLSIRILDTQTKKVVRELWGCMGQISDFCFSNDGRWIIAASMDSVIRVWDLPTGHLINAFQSESPCTALAFSTTGEFLATAHADSVGVHLWNNRSLFTHVSTRPIKEEDITMLMTPTTSGANGTGMIDAAFDDSNEEDDSGGILTIDDRDDSESLDQGMQKLSLVPKSRWQTLLHLDTIRQRNKPIEPPKAPEKAPFFLPSLNGEFKDAITEISDVTEVSKNATKAERSRISRMDRATLVNPFTTLLQESYLTKDFTAFLTHLSKLPPSVADVEIRSLNLDEFVPFVRSLIFGLREQQGYELMQAWMSVFLRIHGEAISLELQTAGLREALEEWKVEQTKEGRRLGDLVGFCGGVVGFLRSVR